MSFKARTDYFGLASAALVCTDSADGKSAQTVTALDEGGSVVAREVFGETKSPSASYSVKATVTASIKIGGVNEVSDESFVLGSVTINTGADVEPKIQAAGEQVQDDATAACTYTVSLAGLTTRRHAQALFGAWTASSLTGDAKINTANYVVAGSIGKATVNGDCVAFDVTQGTITCTLEIVQYGTNAPVFTAPSGWKVTAPLAETSNDAQYARWSMTLVKDLAADTAA